MLENPPDIPRQELWNALAGPATSLLLAAVALGVWAVVRIDLVLELAAVNAVLGVFNLVPAFPMDGGRVVRAVLAMNMSPVRATRIAARIGRVIAAVLVVIGLVDGQLMLALVGGFVFIAAGAEERGAAIRHVLTTWSVADIMHRTALSLGAAATVEELSELVARDPKSPAWPVAFGDRVLGVVHQDGLPTALAHGPREALDRNVVTTRVDTPLRAVIAQMNAARSRAAVVLDGERSIIGVLSAERIAQALRDAGVSARVSAAPRTAD